MFRFLLVLTISIFDLSLQAAHACSCAWNLSVSDLEKSEATVLLASPVGGYSQPNINLYGKIFDHNVPTRFKVWKAYLGEADKYENISMSQLSSCRTSYPLNEVSVIVAYRKNGRLSTSYCTSHQFNRTQLIDYFEHGKDTLGRNFCYKQIKNAYEAEFFSSKLKLENNECLAYKDEYDSRYRIKIHSE